MLPAAQKTRRVGDAPRRCVDFRVYAKSNGYIPASASSRRASAASTTAPRSRARTSRARRSSRPSSRRASTSCSRSRCRALLLLRHRAATTDIHMRIARRATLFYLYRSRREVPPPSVRPGVPGDRVRCTRPTTTSCSELERRDYCALDACVCLACHLAGHTRRWDVAALAS